jgi:hypothetical protein
MLTPGKHLRLTTNEAQAIEMLRMFDREQADPASDNYRIGYTTENKNR